MISIIIFFIGLVIIIKGSDIFIDNVIIISKKFNISDVVIGATLVSICTALPELCVSVSSAMHNLPGMSFGNAIGSVCFNIAIALSTVFILSKAVIHERLKLILYTLSLFLVCVYVYIFAISTGTIPRIAGAILCFVTVIYFYIKIKEMKSDNSNANKKNFTVISITEILKILFFLILGAAMTIYGADLLVDSGEEIAYMLKIPDIIIGMTFTSIGTSLPELMTCITAIKKKSSNIGIGTMIGSSFLDITLVLGLSSAITPIHVEPKYLSLYLPFVTAITFYLLFATMRNKKEYKKLDGFILIAIYLIFLYLICVK